MDFKKLVVPLLLLMMVSTATAGITVTINKPTANQTLNPNTTDQIMDINFTVVDTNAEVALHYVKIVMGEVGIDINKTIATDLNLSTTNCSFHTADTWTTPGVTCSIKYEFPTATSEKLATGTWVIDVNVSSLLVDETYSGQGEAVRVINIDNRWISVSVEAMLLLLPLILIAVVLVGIVLAMASIIQPRTVLFIAVGAIVSVIAVIVFAAILEVLTP